MNRKARKHAAKIFRALRKLGRHPATDDKRERSVTPQRDRAVSQMVEGHRPMGPLEQAIWIKERYGLEIGSRVVWTPAAIKKESQPASREKMRRDGVGIIERFKWWGDGTITVAVYFPGRKRPNRALDYCRTTAYLHDF